MTEIPFYRQEGIFDPSSQRMKISVIGVGSVGSFIALTLAKLGFNDIEITDMDSVSDVNIPNQFYRIKDIGKPKVEALKEIIMEFTGTEVTAKNEKITEESQLDISIDRLYIIGVDNIEARKTIYNKLKGSPMKMLDGGMGGEEFMNQVIELDNEEHQKEYEFFLLERKR